MSFENKMIKMLNKRVENLKNGKTKSIPFDPDKFWKKGAEHHAKRLERTTPAQRLVEKINIKIDDLKSNVRFLVGFEKILNECKTIRIKEFLTGELRVCSIHKTGKCNCHYGPKEPKKYHPNGKQEWSSDIGVYNPKEKDYEWFFVVEVKDYAKKEKLQEKKWNELKKKKKIKNRRYPAYKKDPLVDRAYNFNVHKSDIFTIVIDKKSFTKDDVVEAIRKFIKDYYKLDKEVVWKTRKK